ncbi:g5431 [Coccomyxa elongata]
MLAYTLGAEVVLPSARKRSSFDNFYVSDPFVEVPIHTLLDVHHIKAYWVKHGLIVHENLGGVFPSLHGNRSYAGGHLQTPLEIIVDPNPGKHLRELALEIYTRIEASVQDAVSPHYVLLINRGGLQPFTPDRVEDDLREKTEADPVEIRKELVHSTLVRLPRTLLAPTEVLYVASGIMSYIEPAEMAAYEQMMLDFGMGRSIAYKEMFIPKVELQALHSEQNALIDFIVVQHSRQFIGNGHSTFSQSALEFRNARGVSHHLSFNLL